MMAMMAVASTVMTSCDNDDDESVDALKFGAKSISVAPGESVSTTVSGGTAPYTVATSNKDIAEGQAANSTITISGKKAGKAILTVTDKNNLAGRITVTVADASKSLKLDKSSLSLAAGKSETISVKNGTQPFTATPADKSIATATVSGAKIEVKAVKAGKTTIAVADKNKLSATITVEVK